jgi:crotonobetainyl-CoA:carnitine CoA-transferase CaiB-like acyl-CoA transferase
VTQAAPTLGQHTEFVIRRLLAYADTQIRDLAIDGAFDHFQGELLHAWAPG